MNIGVTSKIIKITGTDQTKAFLEKLGFLENTEISIVSKIGQNVIVMIKESRVAISKEMANRIYVA